MGDTGDAAMSSARACQARRGRSSGQTATGMMLPAHVVGKHEVAVLLVDDRGVVAGRAEGRAAALGVAVLDDLEGLVGAVQDGREDGGVEGVVEEKVLDCGRCSADVVLEIGGVCRDGPAPSAGGWLAQTRNAGRTAGGAEGGEAGSR